jgi:hypothetical protein
MYGTRCSPLRAGQMTLSDGNIKTFEVSVEQFNQLRFNVASVLRDMKKLERHPIMKIAFEQDKNRFDEEKTPQWKVKK